MRISEVKGIEGIELLGELLEPIVNILSDKKVFANLYSGSKYYAFKYIAEGHAEDALKILTACAKVEEYEADAFTMANELYEILTDESLIAFFGLQAQPEKKTSSKSTGSATVNTKETKKK